MCGPATGVFDDVSRETMTSLSTEMLVKNWEEIDSTDAKRWNSATN